MPPSICHIQYSDTPLFSETSLIDNPNSNLLAFMLRPTISCNSCNSSILYHLKRWPGRRALHQPMAPSEDNKTPARTCLIFIGALSQRIFISIMRFLSPKVALVTPPECGYNKTLGERNGVRVGFYLGLMQPSSCSNRSDGLTSIISLSSLFIIRHFTSCCKHYLPVNYPAHKKGPATITVTGP